MLNTTHTTSRKSKTGEHVLVIAEHGVDLTVRFAELERAGCRTDHLVQRATEGPSEFTRRLGETLRNLKTIPDRTIFVAREPVGPRLHELVRTIVCSMHPGLLLMLATDQRTPYATRALSALAITVMEMTDRSDVLVEGAPRDQEPARAWRSRLDRALVALSVPPDRAS